MRKVLLFVGASLALTLLFTVIGTPQTWDSSLPDLLNWGPNERHRPEPVIITPGTESTQDTAGRPPSDAIILFNGKDLSNWEEVKGGGPAQWTVGDGYFATVPNTGDIQTKEPYGDCQLHVEWSAPNPPHGTDQDRGNSGVFLHGLYEIQVLDSFDNVTYADGEAAAVYGQYPPLVNACRKPGEWQTYDIVFHEARFDAAGHLKRRANVTVFFNGVLVHDHVELTGPTANHERPHYKPMPEKLPLRLQDHHHPVRYRNLWLRELQEGE